MYSGRVEIQYNSTWGTICDDSFTNQNAEVLCHMLGFGRTGVSYGGTSVFGEGSGTIWLDDLVCTGSETSITQCRSNGWGIHNCGHSEDISITCSPGNYSDFYLLMTDTNNRCIYKMDMNTFNYEVVPLGSHDNPISIDLDCLNQEIYWTDVGSKQIRAASITGSNERVVRQLGSMAIPDGISIDQVSRLLFYTDTGYDIIAIVTLNGSFSKTIIDQNLEEPRAIVTNPQKGVFYWTDWGGNARIEMANYDGTGRRVIITHNIIWPNALAIDFQGNKIYWADGSTKLIEVANLDGTGRRTVLDQSSTLAHFFGLVLYQTTLYYTDWSQHSVLSVSTNSTSASPVAVGPATFGRLNDIHIYRSGVRCAETNACTNGKGGCSHICLPGPENVRKCACPDGFFLQPGELTCGTDIDECQSSPCVHGNCTDGINQYSCQCDDDYTGTNCETVKDRCASSPCVYGICTDQVNGYICSCNSGYTGRICDTDIDECQSLPCIHGKCLDEINHYTCQCDEGYTGTNCERDADECASSPCMHGDCTDQVNGYICNCIAGYTGKNCDIDIDDCQNSPCRHGNCSDGVNKYTCQCVQGYTGTNCETDIDECVSFPCVHGNCLDQINGYVCNCISGYAGKICETDIDECQSSPCVYGNCLDGINQYSCQCFDGYTGMICETEYCNTPPRVINCPADILVINLTENRKNISLSSFTNLPTIYGQSCNGVNLTTSFPETEIEWSPNIQTFEITASDVFGRSLPCVIRLQTKDMVPPIFENCPSYDIELYGTDKGATVFWPPIRVQDNSGNVTLTGSNLPGEAFPLGASTVQYNATDELGNTNLCFFNVTVKKLPTEKCQTPPQVLHGSLICQDPLPLQCFIDNCEDGYLQTNNHSFVCEHGFWTPMFPEEFSTTSCIKPEPILLERNYLISFTCSNVTLSPVDLRDCIYQSGLCPRDHISLCDNPFKRITESQISSSDFRISMTMEGTLIYASDRNDLVHRMDNHGNAIATHFTSGNFTHACHQLMCKFEYIKADPLQQKCKEGTVQEFVNGKPTCRKCGPGWFNYKKECVPCGKGFYQDLEGQTECKRCPNGTSSLVATKLLSKCFIDLAPEKHTSSLPPSTQTVKEIAVAGIFLIVIVVFIVMVMKCRRSRKQHTFENPIFEDSCPDIDNEIMLERN